MNNRGFNDYCDSNPVVSERQQGVYDAVFQAALWEAIVTALRQRELVKMVRLYADFLQRQSMKQCFCGHVPKRNTASRSESHNAVLVATVCHQADDTNQGCNVASGISNTADNFVFTGAAGFGGIMPPLAPETVTLPIGGKRQSSTVSAAGW